MKTKEIDLNLWLFLSDRMVVFCVFIACFLSFRVIPTTSFTVAISFIVLRHLVARRRLAAGIF